MLKLLKARKGKETKVRITWQLENWSHIVLKDLHKQSSIRDAELLMVILCSIRYEPKHSTSQRIKKSTQILRVFLSIQLACTYRRRKSLEWGKVVAMLGTHPAPQTVTKEKRFQSNYPQMFPAD